MPGGDAGWSDTRSGVSPERQGHSPAISTLHGRTWCSGYVLCQRKDIYNRHLFSNKFQVGFLGVDLFPMLKPLWGTFLSSRGPEAPPPGFFSFTLGSDVGIYF